MMNFKTGDYQKYEAFIRHTEQHLRLPEHLLAVTLYQASGYDPDKIAGKNRNPIGAIGIANLTQADAKTLWGADDRRLDPYASIAGAGRLLAGYKEKFGEWRFALLAHHTNPDIVRRVLQCDDPIPIDANRYVSEARSVCGV
jgi:hypothetical protein